ncbi:hypothetical protein D3C72_1493090 [compost metagenome]
MSLARCWNAYWNSQSTILTMCASLASGSWSLAPRLSSCSKLPRVLTCGSALFAPVTDLARRKNSTLKRWMSTGLATTRLIGNLSTWVRSASQPLT